MGVFATNVSAVRDRVVVLEAAVVTIQGNITTIQGINTTVAGQITALQGADTTMAGQISTLQGNVTTLQGNITTLQGVDTTHSGQISTLQGNITTLQGVDTGLQTSVTNLDAELSLLQRSKRYSYSGLAMNTYKDTDTIKQEITSGGGTSYASGLFGVGTSSVSGAIGNIYANVDIIPANAKSSRVNFVLGEVGRYCMFGLCSVTASSFSGGQFAGFGYTNTGVCMIREKLGGAAEVQTTLVSLGQSEPAAGTILTVELESATPGNAVDRVKYYVNNTLVKTTVALPNTTVRPGFWSTCVSSTSAYIKFYYWGFDLLVN